MSSLAINIGLSSLQAHQRALQIVSALSAGCRALVTNDRNLPAVPGLPIVQLSSYL